MRPDPKRVLACALLVLPGCADAARTSAPDAAIEAGPDAPTTPADAEVHDAATDAVVASPCGPCDDGNPCTKDKCDEASATCQHVAIAAVCDDGDACTAADACKTGQCSGIPKTCSDDDPCTVDACKPGVGCVHEPKCPVGTSCHPLTLQCVNLTAPNCSVSAGWGWTVQFANQLEVPKPDGGCDLDDDGKPNNVLGKVVDLYPQLNKSLAASLEIGGPTFLLFAKAYQGDGSPFSLDVLRGRANVAEGACTAPACKVTVDSASFASTTGACAALSTLDATATATKLSAVGSGFAEPLPFPLFAGFDLPLQILSVNGSVPDGPVWSGTQTGKICGYIPAAALQAMPPAPGGGGGTFTAGVLKPDFDSDGDGDKDGVSFALDFGSVPAVVTGLTPGG